MDDLWPERPRKPKKKKETASLRASEEQAAYLERLNSKGYRNSQVLDMALNLLMDMERELGSEMRAILRAAEDTNCTLGALVGRAVQAGWPTVSSKLKK